MRREVVEIICDRCGKKENQVPTAADNFPKPEFTVSFHGTTVKYEDLCNACRRSVGNYYSSIVRPDPRKSENKPPKEEKKEEPKKGFFS